MDLKVCLITSDQVFVGSQEKNKQSHKGQFERELFRRNRSNTSFFMIHQLPSQTNLKLYTRTLGLCQEIHTTNGYCSSHFLLVSCLAFYFQPRPEPSRLRRCRAQSLARQPEGDSGQIRGNQQPAQHPHLTLSSPGSPA